MNTSETVSGGLRPSNAVDTLLAMTSLRPPSLIACAIVAGLIAVGCGSSPGSSDDTTPSDPPAVESNAPADNAAATDAEAPEDAGPADGGAVVDESAAPDAAPEILRFTSPLVGGGEIDAAALADRPTAFWFWSPT